VEESLTILALGFASDESGANRTGADADGGKISSLTLEPALVITFPSSFEKEIVRIGPFLTFVSFSASNVMGIRWDFFSTLASSFLGSSSLSLGVSEGSSLAGGRGGSKYSGSPLFELSSLSSSELVTLSAESSSSSVYKKNYLSIIGLCV
jgi:hypothetical protein